MRLSEKYEFRSIHREEAEQAAEIEQICFPPAEAISRADVIDRVEKIPELFLVAVDRKTESWQDISQDLRPVRRLSRINFYQCRSL